VVDCGVRFRRGWIVVGVVAVVAVAAAVYGWRAERVRPGDTVWLADGRVAFRMPVGWRRVGCPGAASTCVYLRTPGGTDDVIGVVVGTPGASGSDGPVVARAADPATMPGGRSFTVDGASFARVHIDAVPARPAATVVTGLLHNGDRVFMSCVETAEADLVRAGCELVIGSSHVRS